MKGHKDSDGRFHPHTKYKKGVRKSRDQSAKTQGVRMARIYQDDPDAIAKLEKKLEGLEKERAYWKTVKKTVPRDYSNTEGDKKWYMPQLINAKIRDTKKKIEKIKERQEKNIGLKRKTTFKDGKKVFYYEEVPNERKSRYKKDIESIIDEEVERRVENLSEDEYDDYLDEFGSDELFRNYPYSELLKSSDEIAYRTGYNDWLDGEITGMEGEIEKEAEERADQEIMENPSEFGLTEKDIEDSSDAYIQKLEQRTEELESEIRQEKEDELDEDAYDDYLDNLGDDVGIGSLNLGAPSRVLKEVDPTAYRVGFNDWSDGERDRIRDEVTDEIDDDESLKQGVFIEA